MAKEQVIHKDILGQPLSEGGYVAVSRHNMLEICRIVKLNPKMMRVMPLRVTRTYGDWDGHLVYASQSISLSGPDALAYILTYAGST